METAPARKWDWFTATLLFLLLQVGTARLVATNWAPYLYFSESLAALGSMLGLALGVSRFKRRAVIWLSVAYTLVVVPWQICSSADEDHLLDRLQKVGSILLVSLGQFTQRQPVKDSLFFVAFVSLVFWLLSIVAGYAATRHQNVLAAIIPSGAIVLVVQVYANYQLHGSWWLGVFLLIALLMIGRNYYLRNQRIWSEDRVYVHDEAWTDILGALFVAVFVTILLAWLFPTSISSVQAAADSWTRLTHRMEDRLSNAVTALKGPYGNPGPSFFGSDLLLGREAAQGDSPVFTVNVIKAPDVAVRYYWRGRVYDTYRNGQWTTSSSSDLDFLPALGNLSVVDVQGRSEGEYRFTMQLPSQSLLYAPSEAIWTDQRATVEITPIQAGLQDVLSWQAKQSIASGNRYNVHAEIGDPNAPQLRTAGIEYPQWVQDQYLQVPASIQRDFQNLAARVTAGQSNPYDKAVAVTNYLRLNLQYSNSVPLAPEGRDPVDWVLFDYKKGFCNYYASAEVLMLRSVGIPARLAVGFAQGENQNGTYVVRRRDAHAWPEVYFPDLGWVEFEPTVNQLPLVRSDPNASLSSNVPGPSGLREFEPTPAPQTSIVPNATSAVPFSRTPAARLLGIVLPLIAVGLLLYLNFRFHAMRLMPVLVSRAFEGSGLATPAWVQRWLVWTRLLPVEQAFAPVSWSLRWLGQPPAMDATATERASALKKLLPQAVPSIETVASELEAGLFTSDVPNVPRARRAGLLILVHLARARLAELLGM